MSTNANTPTGPVGVLSVESFFMSPGSVKSEIGGSGDSETRLSPSPRKARSDSRCFFRVSLAARFTVNPCGPPRSRSLLALLLFGGLIHVADRDTALLARAFDLGEFHVLFLGLALRGVGYVDLHRAFGIFTGNPGRLRP